MPPSFLTNLSKAHGIPPETAQAAILSLAAAIGDPPAPVEEAPAPAPSHYLSLRLPAFDSTIEESQAEFDARYAIEERERRIVYEHNKAEMRRFHKENDAYVAYRLYIQAAREFEEARAAQLPIHIQAAQNRAETVKRAAIVDSPAPPQENNLLNSAENVQNKKRAATVESPAPPQASISVPYTALPRSRAESHLTVTAAGPEPNPLDGAIADMAEIRDAFRQSQQQLKEMLQLLRQLVDRVGEFGARFVELEEHRIELLGRILAAMEHRQPDIAT